MLNQENHLEEKIVRICCPMNLLVRRESVISLGNSTDVRLNMSGDLYTIDLFKSDAILIHLEFQFDR